MAEIKVDCRDMDPLVGLGLVIENLIDNINIENGTVEVMVSLPGDHQFANNIGEEIVEKLGSLWDVDEVVVKFID